MASLYARTTIRDHIAANWTATPWFDLSDFVDVNDIPAPDAQAYVILQFIGGTDEQVTIGGFNQNGYREEGAFYLHYVAPTGGTAAGDLAVAEQLRALFVGRRFPRLVIRSVTTWTDQEGAAIGVTGPWRGFSAMALFYNDVHQTAVT